MPEPYFSSPWEYYNVPLKDVEKLLQLYMSVYLAPANPTLPKALQQIMYPDAWIQANPQFREMATPKAHEAAVWFVVADFIGMKYQRTHPTFEMKAAPDDVLRYLRPPYNKMRLLGYDDQVKFRETLPDNLKREVFIDA